MLVFSKVHSFYCINLKKKWKKGRKNFFSFEKINKNIYFFAIILSSVTKRSLHYAFFWSFTRFDYEFKAVRFFDKLNDE